MTKIIASVPEYVTRQSYVDLLASIGLDVDDLRHLEFRVDGIYARVDSRDENGNRLWQRDNSPVTHEIHIPVKP
jgi:hypothetical protein